MSSLSIGAVAGRMGLRTSAIRYYESERLLDPTARQSGRRVFDESVFDRLALIQYARGAGFKIAEIRHLLRGFPDEEGPSERWRELVERKQEEISLRMQELAKMKDMLDTLQGCACPDLDACGSAALPWVRSPD